MKNDLVLFKKGLMILRSDFLISGFPVSEMEFAELSGAHLPLLRELFIPVDFGATPPSPMPEPPRDFAAMPRNPAGLAGMLGNVAEWCGEDCPGGEGPKNRACGWAEFITNYNNDLGLEVARVHAPPGGPLPFRAALTAPGK